MRKYFDKSGPKIILAVSCAVIPLIVALCLITASIYKEQEKTLIHKANSTAFVVFENAIEDVGDQASLLASQYRNSDTFRIALASKNVDTLEVNMTRDLNSKDMFAVVYDENGETILTLGTAPTNVAEGNSIAAGESEGVFQDTAMPLSFRKYTSVMQNNKVIGGFCIGYDLANTKLVEKIKEESECEATLFAGNTRLNTTIINPETKERVIGTTMLPEIEQQVLVEQKTIEGENFIVVSNMLYKYKPLLGYNNQVVGAIFIGAPTTDMDNLFTRSTLIIFICSMVIVVALLVLLSIIIQNNISKPIQKVVEQAQNIRDGKLDMEPLLVKSKNEVSVLAATMNDTVVNLNTYISDIDKSLFSMANKDFNVSTNVEYKGEFKKLEEAVELIKSNMRAFIQELNSASGFVNTNAQQMSESSERVAMGTTEQAATVEQFSASVIEISNNVNKNAEDAQQAKQLSNSVESKIDEQSAKMEEMLAAMKEIETRSDEIQKIIKSIDDIAFQTNILALNAAVEAARAGQAGKGFAVVADEVRNLAAKSTEAASNTTSLIQASIDAVKRGSDLVTETASSLEDIVKLSTDTNSLIENISQQSEEQATSLREITIGLNQINDVIQQNSAIAEETHASSEDLSGQSEKLAAMVNEYRI